MAGGHNDASSCSTAASEQSDRRKRSSPNGEESTLQPYECRFCPMKFAKSQALGGHMNRHRQEREREQVMNARQLLMQQEFSSTLMMSGQNAPSALPKLSQAHLQRSASEGSLKDGTRMGVPPSGASAHRGALQSNPYNSSLGPPSLSWNLGDVLDNAQNSVPAFSLDGRMVPSYQTRQAYCSALNNNAYSYIMQQPLNRVHSQHDMMLSAPYHKAVPPSMYPFDSNTPTAHRSNSLRSQQGVQDQAEEGSIMASPAYISSNFMPSSNRSLVQRKSDVKNAHQFSQALSLPSQQNNNIGNGFQFFQFPGTDATRSTLQNPPIDFNLSATNQLDGLPWMHGNTKTAPTLNALSTSDDEYHHELIDNPEPKMDDASLTGTNAGEPKTIRWDLALPSPDNADEESKIQDLTPVVGGAPMLHFETDYTQATSEMDAKNPSSVEE